MGADDLSTVGTGSGVPKGVDATMYLTAQVNRFMGPKAPEKMRLRPDPLPLATGKLDIGTAMFAVVLMDHRTAAAFAEDPSLNARIKRAYANPIGFVEQNMSEVVSGIQAYGDAMGAPPAQFPGAGPSPNIKLAVAAVLGVGVLYMLTRRRR